MTADDPSLAELRARLYRPGADAADLERYRIAAAVTPEPAPTTAPEPVAPVHGPVAVASPWTRRRIVTAAAVLGAAGAAAIALPSVVSAARPRPTASPRPAAVRPTALAVGAADRRAFVSGLEQGGPAGLGTWLRGKSAIDGSIDEYHGAGSSDVALAAPYAKATATSATVVIVLDRAATIDWTLLRLVVTNDRSIELRAMVTRGGRQQAGEPASAAATYVVVGRPVTLRIRADAHVRWGAAMIYR